MGHDTTPTPATKNTSNKQTEVGSWLGGILLTIIIIIFLVYFIFFLYFKVKKYWEEKEENSILVTPPRGSTTYYFHNQDTIKLTFYGKFKFYPKGGCIDYIIPSGKNFEDCPGVDAYYPPGPPGEYIFVKKGRAIAVEILR